MNLLRRKRYVVRHTTGLRPWIVYDRHLAVTHSDWSRKEAARNRAWALNKGSV